MLRCPLLVAAALLLVIGTANAADPIPKVFEPCPPCPGPVELWRKVPHSKIETYSVMVPKCITEERVVKVPGQPIRESYVVDVEKKMLRDVKETVLVPRDVKKKVVEEVIVTKPKRVVTTQDVTRCEERSCVELVRDPCRILPHFERQTWIEPVTRREKSVEIVEETKIQKRERCVVETVNVPVERTRTVAEKVLVPETRYRMIPTEVEKVVTVNRTVMVPETRTRCVCWTTWERVDQAPKAPSLPSQELPIPRQMPMRS